MTWFEHIFGCKHEPIWINRTLVDKYTKFSNAGCMVDSDVVLVYTYEGYCFKCREELKKMLHIYEALDSPKPYDSAPT